jgi:hypothetical protein
VNRTVFRGARSASPGGEVNTRTGTGSSLQPLKWRVHRGNWHCESRPSGDRTRRAAISAAPNRCWPILVEMQTLLRSVGRLTVIFAVACCITGCQTTPQPVGATGVQATFVLGSLKAELPPSVGVMTAVAATEVALRDRGYVITSRSAVEDHGRLKGRRAGGADHESVVVSVSPTAQGTAVSVFVEPFGDEVGSRILMESIVLRLAPDRAAAAQ